MPKPKYKRVLLKLSGESLMDPLLKFGISLPIVNKLAEEIKDVHSLGTEIAIVLGGLTQDVSDQMLLKPGVSLDEFHVLACVSDKKKSIR